MVTVANTKMMVSPTSRMSSAISFGVFCRSAPSTSLIMRSRKVEPAAAVMRTRIQSDRTWVPPVTADRSPPHSRITGADSPVIAASLTEAMPSITSPSEGMKSPASTSTTSPTFRLVLGMSLMLVRSSPASSLAMVSVCWRRSEFACALPRPSAMASAKLANSTVNHSQITIWNSNASVCPPVRRSRTRMTVVSSVTTSSTNMTGFFMRVRGSSLTKAEPIAGITIMGSNSAETGMRLRIWVSIGAHSGSIRREGGAGDHREMLDQRAERERREEGEAADDDDDADDEADKQPAGGREGAERGRHGLLGRERAGDRHGRNDHPEAADQHRDGERDVVEQRIPREAGESRAVVGVGRDVGVHDLGEAVRARVGRAGKAGRGDRCDRGPAEIHQRQDEDGEHGHLDLLGLDLLADVLGRAADHQAGDEDRDDDEQQHAVHAGADAADDDLDKLHVDQRDHATERGEGIVHRIDCTAGGRGSDHGEQRRGDDAESHLLAFHIAASEPEGIQRIVAVRLGPVTEDHAGDEQNAHHRKHGPPLLLVTNHAAKHVGQRRT